MLLYFKISYIGIQQFCLEIRYFLFLTKGKLLGLVGFKRLHFSKRNSGHFRNNYFKQITDVEGKQFFVQK